MRRTQKAVYCLLRIAFGNQIAGTCLTVSELN